MTYCTSGSRLAAQIVGDPVDVVSGANFDQTLEFRLTGPLELWWYRHYDSSQSHRRFALGWGQTHDFDRILRLDADGISYVAPLGRIFGFPPLSNDGAECASQGFVLRRLSIRQYQLFHHGKSAMEFEFHHPLQPARLKRLFQGEHQILFRYNDSRQLERIVDSAGRKISVVEEADGRMASLTLQGEKGKPELLLVAYQYDEHGNLVGTRNDAGHGYVFDYDDANRLIRRTGRTGFNFYFAYDQQGRCVKAVGDRRLQGVALDYDIPGRVTKVTRADLGVWTYFFDEGGLTQIIDPLGGVQQFVRGKTGRVTTEVDANGNTTRVVYDATGAAIAKISPLGHRMSLPEDPNAPDPLTHRVAANPAEYEFGRLLDIRRITLPDTTQARGLPLSPEARRLVCVRPEQIQSPKPAKQFDVRPLGVLWWPEPRTGRVFNDLGKLVQQHDEFGRQRQWSYDASGNLAGYVDYDGGKWIYDHGLWHFLTGFINPLGAEVRFSYTSTGEVVSCTDAGGTRSEYRYDLKDKLVDVKRHGVVRETYTRDAAGNLIAKYASDGRELLRIEIGRGNLPIKRTLASGDEHNFQYDESGRYLMAATTKDSVQFAYDRVGNQVVEKRNGQGVASRFHGWNAPAESVFFDHFAVRYEWEADSTLAISDPGGKSHEIRFLPHGLVEHHFSNGSQETAQYDNLGRCLFKCVQRGNGQIWSRRYHWSGEGELQRTEDNTLGEIRHEYDSVHRLCRRFIAGRVEDYEMDLADNLLKQPGLAGVTLREGNRLKTANGFRFAYNDRNHIEAWETAEGLVRYSYDSRDQLVHVKTPKGIWEAEYDALGRRTRKTWAGQTTEYYWNTDQLIAEVNSVGQVRLYVYADPLALTPLLFLDYESVGAPPESGQRYFVFTNQIGTPCLVEDDNGNEVWRARIAAFGQAEVASSAKIDFSLRFPGHYFDTELGLHYNRFRYYAPTLGRYLQSDPWGITGGYNLYAYRSNPLLQVDVRGLGEENARRGLPCEDDEEGTSPPQTPSNEESGLPRLGQQEGQQIVNDIHDALPDGSIAARNSTTTLTETQDGSLIVTNSDRVTPEMRQAITDMQEPGGSLHGRNVLVPDDQHNPGYIPPAQRDLPPQGPNNTPTGAENHGEQRGIQAANYYDEHGDGNGQGHGPADTQWSRSEAGHQGQACPHCAAAQQQNNVHNPTGVDPNR